MTSPTDAVFFISFGGPEKREDIRPYLEIVTRGRPIPPERMEEVAHHYTAIGGSSPINAVTHQQAKGLEKVLAQTDTPWPVYIGNRNWHPFIEDTLKKMVADGVKRAVGFCTAAYRSEASLERYVNAVEAARQKIGPPAPVIDFVGPWFDHPLFIQAIARRTEDAIATVPEKQRKSLSWIFTAHSIPCGMAKESTYVIELRKTAELVCKKLGQPDWTYAYTSRSGAPTDLWLEPDISDEIRAQAKRGVKNLLIIPIGFIADHVEILFDLDVEAKATAREEKLPLYRAKTVGDHPLFIQMIADVVRLRAQQEATPENTSSTSTRFQDGRKESNPGRFSRMCYCQPNATDPPCTQVKPASGTRPMTPAKH